MSIHIYSVIPYNLVKKLASNSHRCLKGIIENTGNE